MTVRPQNAEETSHSEIKYETNDNSNHTHKPKKDKNSNPELEHRSAFLLTELRGREWPLLCSCAMKALSAQHIQYKNDKLQRSCSLWLKQSESPQLLCWDTFSLSSASWVEIADLEGTYKDQWVQLPDHFRGKQKFKKCIKCIVQMPLRHWQECNVWKNPGKFSATIPSVILLQLLSWKESLI